MECLEGGASGGTGQSDVEANSREGNEVKVWMECLEGGASGSAGQSNVEANVSGLSLHVRRKERWIRLTSKSSKFIQYTGVTSKSVKICLTK